MDRCRNLFARVASAAAFSLVLGAATASDAAAGVSIQFSTGHSHQHRPRYSHGVPFIKRRHYNHGHHRPHFRGHRGRHVLSSGCSPATQRYRDRHGHLVIRHVTVCFDRYGRRYVLGGRGPGRH